MHFRPVAHSRFIYVAHEHGTTPPTYKVGRTRQLPAQRCRALGGQSDRRFELLYAFETADEYAAEAQALKMLDELGLRKYPGTLKELFFGELEVIRKVCEEAARSAACKTTRVTRKPAKRAALKMPKNALWAAVLGTPITQQGASLRLIDALELALYDRGLERRLARQGLYKEAYCLRHIEYTIEWAEAKNVVLWLNSIKIKMPDEPRTRFSVKHAS